MIDVSSGFILVITLFFYFDREGLLMHALAVFIIHEAAHMLTLRLLGARIRCVKLTALGAEIEACDRQRLSYRKEAVCAAAGPVANIAAAFLFSLAGKVTGCEDLYITAGISLIAGLFNLLPAIGLDGGRMLWFLLCAAKDGKRADTVLHYTSLLTGAALFPAGLWLMTAGKWNVTLLIAAVWILFMLAKTRKTEDGMEP